MLKSKIAKLVNGLFLLLSAGFLVLENKTVPVLAATSNDWHKDTFWIEPWGAS